jgi:PepSY-associated transmembrane protein
MMKLLRKWLILTHRYAGVVLSVFVVLWFATGITMMYAGGMPRLTPEMRLEKLPSLDLARVRLTPAEAAEAGLIEQPGRAVLLSIMGRPAYRFGAGEPTTVFADTGEVMEGASLTQARTIAARFAGVTEDQVAHIATLERVDQWTLVQSRQLPLHKFRVSDERGTELYVSPRIGEVTMVTTRNGRALAWISTIPHFFYFAALRENQPVWYQFVVWTSGLVCALAVLGLLLGIVQSFRQKYVGAMKWHYVTGLVFGVFTATWAFSGLLSMEPFEWTNSQPLEVGRHVFTGGPIDLGKYAAMKPAEWDHLVDGRGIKEIELSRIQDEHFYVVRLAHDPDLSRHSGAAASAEADKRPERLHQPYYITGRSESDRLLVRADTLQVRRQPFSTESLVARLRTELPEVPIVEQQLLTEYDAYYYSRQHLTPLPVLRVKFADPGETWFYIDPSNSTMLSQVTRLSRIERWLYNGLHSLDFPFWYDIRPAWDIVMLVLLLGGLISSSIGLVLGFSRVARGVRHLAPFDGAQGRPAHGAAPAPSTSLQERDA